MKNLLVTLSLTAALAGSLAAIRPAPVNATPSIPIPPPQIGAPDLSKLALKPILAMPLLPIQFKAELTADLYTQPVGPNYPHWHWIIAVVRNTGLVSSGPFQTLITRVYAGTPSLPGPAIATPVAMSSIAAGSQRAIVWAEYLSGPLKVGAYADFTHVVPEYNEANNTDTLTVFP
jgi:hypothetical protein